MLSTSKKTFQLTAQAADSLNFEFLSTSMLDLLVYQNLKIKLLETGIPTVVGTQIHASRSLSAAVRGLGLPIFVIPRGRGPGGREFRLDAVEEATLAAAHVAKSGSDTAIVESPYSHPVYAIYGLVFRAQWFEVARFEKIFPEREYRFAQGYRSAPSGNRVQHAADLASQTVTRVGVNHGLVCVEIHDAPQPEVANVQFGPYVDAPPALLEAQCPGFHVKYLRIAAGEEPAFRYENTTSSFYALQWLTCGSGIVSAIEGVEPIREDPNICEVHVSIQPGAVVRHITSRRERDKIGYVLARGGSSEEALANATGAALACKIVTQPFRT